MFLHGGWGHLLGNAIFLWVFGNNIEDSMGPPRFLIFYLLCGLVAAAAQVLLSADITRAHGRRVGSDRECSARISCCIRAFA